MNISSIIKREIIAICGGPVASSDNLPDDTPLFHLGYDEDDRLCKQLEHRLQMIAAQYQPDKAVQNTLLSASDTVSYCINLVINS